MTFCNDYFKINMGIKQVPNLDVYLNGSDYLLNFILFNILFSH